jgi:hypothetical protein
MEVLIMDFLRTNAVLVVIFMALALFEPGRSQTQAAPPPQAQPQTSAPPSMTASDPAILYKRAVVLLDNAEKNLSAMNIAEARALVKEANSMFGILVKECGPAQKERLLTPKEEEQEAINQKFSRDEQAEAERLMKSAEEKEKKSTQLEASQPEVSVKYQKEAKEEYKQSHKRSIKAQIYALRNQQMLFRFLSP